MIANIHSCPLMFLNQCLVNLIYSFPILPQSEDELRSFAVKQIETSDIFVSLLKSDADA